MDDFNKIPALERHGGLYKARQVFGDKLEKLVSEINESVAA